MRAPPGCAMLARMRIASLWRRALDAALDLLYPPRCGGCGRHGEGWLCPACRARLSLLDDATPHDLDLGASGARLPVFSAAAFAPPLREAIHAFKYDGTPQLADAFGELMSAAWRARGWRADVAVPVPLHPARLRERGYNQSDLLARAVARECGLRHCAALQRVRPTQQQAHLDAAARRDNVHDAFRATPARVAGVRVVLIDDVLTTGATLGECAQALLAGGAASVAGLTLARARA